MQNSEQAKANTQYGEKNIVWYHGKEYYKKSEVGLPWRSSG